MHGTILTWGAKQVGGCTVAASTFFSFRVRVAWSSRPPCSIVAGYACSHPYMVFNRVVSLLAVGLVVVGSLEDRQTLRTTDDTDRGAARPQTLGGLIYRLCQSIPTNIPEADPVPPPPPIHKSCMDPPLNSIY